MRIVSTGRFVFAFQWLAALLLPVFFFVGRGLVGSPMGWLTLGVIVYGPFALMLLLVPPIIVLFDREVRRRGATRRAYDVASFVLWGAIVVGGLAVPDAGDNPDAGSALTVWTAGGISEEWTSALTIATLGVALIAYLAAIGLAVAGTVRSGRGLSPTLGSTVED